VSLPARTVADARSEIVEARAAGADVAELRVDRLPADEVGRLDGLFPSPLPLIATLRSRAEGGEGPVDAERRAQLLRDVARYPFRWIDAERNRDFPAAETLSRPAVQELIVSTHFPGEASGSQWGHLLREPVPLAALVKVVGPSSVGHLFREVIPSFPPIEERRFTAHSTGASGPLLRAWSKRFGFPFVYASLPERSDASRPASVEPSQIPVDRLKPFLDAEGTPPLFAVIGHPVAHSRSPAIFSRWMREDGRPGLYVALDLGSDEEFTDALPALTEGGFRGLSVTHPFKAVAFELADEVGPGATACGVANTLTLSTDRVSAENTDLVAILRRLGELRASGAWDGGSVGVVGAGGAARATLAATRTLGVEAFVWARRAGAADSLAREFGAHSVPTTDAARPTLVVHATPVGRASEMHASRPDLGWLRPGVHVVDWVYAPEDPVVRATAERFRATYEDGTRLLVYQAAASYGLWWGAEPSADRVESAIRSFL
jgi:shikimate dehydrogenase